MPAEGVTGCAAGDWKRNTNPPVPPATEGPQSGLCTATTYSSYPPSSLLPAAAATPPESQVRNAFFSFLTKITVKIQHILIHKHPSYKTQSNIMNPLKHSQDFCECVDFDCDFSAGK